MATKTLVYVLGVITLVGLISSCATGGATGEGNAAGGKIEVHINNPLPQQSVGSDNLKSKNERPRRDTSQLKRGTERESEKHSQSSSSHVSAENLVAAVRNMMARDVAGFLIRTVPKVKGGVSCTELVQLVSHGISRDVARVVKNVSGYIQRPIRGTCVSRLGKAMISRDIPDAIDHLMSSTPAY